MGFLKNKDNKGGSCRPYSFPGSSSSIAMAFWHMSSRTPPPASETLSG